MDQRQSGADASERGKRGSFDPATGEVHGSGSDAGGGGNPREDYDEDSASGGGRDPVGGARPLDEAPRGPQDRHQGQEG